MRKLKEIEKMFSPIHCSRGDNNQYLFIDCCAIGDNGYDYNEEPPKEYNWNKIDPSLARELKNDFRIKIIGCEDCCRCGSW